jgi:hypothetical protein
VGENKPRSIHTAARVVVTTLVLAPFVGTLWVPFYARTTPKLGAFPFFYWYQLMWVPAVAVLSGLAYLIASRLPPRAGPPVEDATGGTTGPTAAAANGPAAPDGSSTPAEGTR